MKTIQMDVVVTPLQGKTRQEAFAAFQADIRAHAAEGRKARLKKKQRYALTVFLMSFLIGINVAFSDWAMVLSTVAVSFGLQDAFRQWRAAGRPSQEELFAESALQCARVIEEDEPKGEGGTVH
jgi:hypothetical protein